jgi:hypothetical protein
MKTERSQTVILKEETLWLKTKRMLMFLSILNNYWMETIANRDE